VVLEVGQDAAGHLTQVGGMGEQVGEVLQRSRRKLIESTSNVSLGA
jgi:hypothetical protein